MKKITLVFPKSSWKFEKTPYPPLGIGYLAAVLAQEGWEVSIIDGQILNAEEYEKQIKGISEGIVGISTTLKQINETLRIAALIKQNNSGIPIIVGGAGVIVFDLDPSLTSHVDLIIKGEAEKYIIPLLNKIKNFQKKQKPQTITCKNPSNLDELPYPAYDLFPLERYLTIWKKNTGITSVSMITSRGCPYRCIFCDKNISGWKFRARSPKNVVNEMEFLLKKYKNIDDIFFYDDLFVADRARVIEICHEIRRRKLEVSWSAQGRVDRIDEEMLHEMKEAGCTELYFGVESGSDRILQWLRKGFTKKQIIQAFKLCHKVGIKPGMYLIVGVPGETKEDINATKDLIQKCRPYLLNFSYLTPFPGTELFKKTKKCIQHYNFSSWDEMNNSIYDFPFEIDPKKAHDEIYYEFQKMIDKGMECSPLQFCCEQ